MSTPRLLDSYDALLVDLDGVVHLGDDPVPGAAEALTVARDAGLAVVFVTNNASRTPEQVAAGLAGRGVAATPEQVITSATATAAVLAGRLPPQAPVLVVGGDALADALSSAGLRPVRLAADEPVVVVQGWAPEVGWEMLAEAAVAMRAGAEWVATNDDRTLPSPRGPLPGNGSLVAALATATGRRPEVVGKPHPPLFTAARELAAARRPLVVGDRLDTDIAGAVAAGFDSVVVLTGVADAGAVLRAEPAQRPTYVAADLRGVTEPIRVVRRTGDAATCGDVTVTADGTVTGGGGVDALRAAAALAWDGVLDDAAVSRVVAALG